MLFEIESKRVGRLVATAIFMVTVIVTPNSSLDPINVPKLWVLCAFGFASIFMLAGKWKTLFDGKNRILTISILALPTFMFLGIFFTDSTITREFFGTYGRNTGFLTYFSFAALALIAAFAGSESIRKPILFGITCAISVNVIYGLIQALGKDPQNWVISYTPVFGTLGNPDFISAFLGFGAAFPLAYLFSNNTKPITKVLCSLYLPISLYNIYKSGSQQGLVVFAIVLGLVVYFEIKNFVKAKAIHAVYLLLFLVTGVVAILGTLQRGPLAELIYRSSVSVRGYYWNAGIKMISENPIFGVGLDSYGDWYRSSRSILATESNASVVSNSAHNVFIDIAATAGLPALFAYLAFIFLALKSAWKIFKKNEKLEPFFISVFVAWMGYLAQSTISINNLALGIWGWVLPGLIIGLERFQETEVMSKNRVASRKNNALDLSGMMMTVGLVIGGAIGFIPFNADANFRHSIEAGTPNSIFVAAQKWPTDTSRLIYGALLFQSNKLDKQALDLAQIALKQNPRSFEAWDFVSKSPVASEADKKQAINEMIKLDPYNKSIKQ